jgi:hypothetical protein
VTTIARLIIIISTLIMWGIVIGAFALLGVGASSLTAKNWIAIGVILPIYAAILFPILRWAVRDARRRVAANQAYMEKLRERHRQ